MAKGRMLQNRISKSNKIASLSSDTVRLLYTCLLYTSDAADDLLCVDLGGRRIIKKKTRELKFIDLKFA